MSVVIKLQNLHITATAQDIRHLFHHLNIPDGGVHIGPNGDAFITFSTDEDARLAMKLSGSCLKDSVIYLSLSSRNEMAEVIEAAHKKAISMLNRASRSSSTVQLPPHSYTSRSLSSSSSSFNSLSMPKVVSNNNNIISNGNHSVSHLFSTFHNNNNRPMGSSAALYSSTSIPNLNQLHQSTTTGGNLNSFFTGGFHSHNNNNNNSVATGLSSSLSANANHYINNPNPNTWIKGLSKNNIISSSPPSQQMSPHSVLVGGGKEGRILNNNYNNNNLFNSSIPTYNQGPIAALNSNNNNNAPYRYGLGIENSNDNENKINTMMNNSNSNIHNNNNSKRPSPWMNNNTNNISSSNNNLIDTHPNISSNQNHHHLSVNNSLQNSPFFGTNDITLNNSTLNNLNMSMPSVYSTGAATGINPLLLALRGIQPMMPQQHHFYSTKTPLPIPSFLQTVQQQQQQQQQQVLPTSQNVNDQDDINSSSLLMNDSTSLLQSHLLFPTNNDNFKERMNGKEDFLSPNNNNSSTDPVKSSNYVDENNVDEEDDEEIDVVEINEAKESSSEQQRPLSQSEEITEAKLMLLDESKNYHGIDNTTNNNRNWNFKDLENIDDGADDVYDDTADNRSRKSKWLKFKNVTAQNKNRRRRAHSNNDTDNQDGQEPSYDTNEASNKRSRLEPFQSAEECTQKPEVLENISPPLQKLPLISDPISSKFQSKNATPSPPQITNTNKSEQDKEIKENDMEDISDSESEPGLLPPSPEVPIFPCLRLSGLTQDTSNRIFYFRCVLVHYAISREIRHFVRVGVMGGDLMIRDIDEGIAYLKLENPADFKRVRSSGEKLRGEPIQVEGIDLETWEKEYRSLSFQKQKREAMMEKYHREKLKEEKDMFERNRNNKKPFMNKLSWTNHHYSMTSESSDMNRVNSRNITNFIQSHIEDVETISKPSIPCPFRTLTKQQSNNDSISSHKNHGSSNNWSSSLDFLFEMTTDPKKCVLITGIPTGNISERNVVEFFSDTGLIPFEIFIFQDGKILCKFADSKKAFRAVMMKNGSKFQDHHREVVSVMLYQPESHSYLLEQLTNNNEQVTQKDPTSQCQPQQQQNYRNEPFEFQAKTLSDSNNNNNRSVSPSFKYKKQNKMCRFPFNKSNSNQQLKSSHGVPPLLQIRPPLLGLAPRPLLNNSHSNNNILLGTGTSFLVPNNNNINSNNCTSDTSIINPLNCRNPFSLAIQQLQSVVNIPKASSSSASSPSFSDKDDRSNTNNNATNARQATAEQVAKFSKPGCVLAMENFPVYARMDDILNFLKETLELDITRNQIIRRFDEQSNPTGDIRLAFDTQFEAQLAQKRLNGVYMYKNFIKCSILTNF